MVHSNFSSKAISYREQNGHYNLKFYINRIVNQLVISIDELYKSTSHNILECLNVWGKDLSFVVATYDRNL